MNVRIQIFIGMAMLGLGASQVYAQKPIAYEPFDYSLGSLNGQGIAEGFASVWSSGMTVVTNDLSYGLLVTNGHSALLGNGSAGASIGTTLSDAGLMDHGTTLWFSVVWRTRDEHTNCDAAFALGSDDLNGANAIPMNSGNGGNGIGAYFRRGRYFGAANWSGGSKGSSATITLQQQQTYLVVGEIIWGADSNAVDTVNLYLPNGELEEKGTIRATRSVVLDQSTFNRVSFGVRTSGEYVDEIRFGAAYEDVALLPPPKGLVISLK